VTTRPRLGVLASGRGSNLAALIDAIDRGDLPATVAVVVSNNAAAGALGLGQARGIPVAHVSSRTTPDPDRTITNILQAHDVDVVVLAGWMKLVGPAMLDAFPDHIVNIHPGPLPRFGGPGMYGHHVHAAVLAAGVSHSAATVHLVNAHYDEGEVLARRSVPVAPGDTPETLAARVLTAEHDLLWRVIRERFCDASPGAGS
jgi:phosphoribosylglycinamide formyltransferase-1